MIRKVSKEVDVKASISKAWEVYGSPAKVGMIIQAEMGHLSSVVVLEGDGGVGTVVEVTPRPGVTLFTRYKERFTKIDHENKVREVEIIDGWYLDLGFKAFKLTLELIDNQQEDACTAKLTIEYEANEEVAKAFGTNLITNSPFMSLIEALNRHIENN
ncbi:hypothetical protein R6Q59_012423 [Mikania micrantha]